MCIQYTAAWRTPFGDGWPCCMARAIACKIEYPSNVLNRGSGRDARLRLAVQYPSVPSCLPLCAHPTPGNSAPLAPATGTMRSFAMSIRKILTMDYPVLRAKAKKVSRFDPWLERLVQD